MLKKCPCGTDKNYLDCCGALITSQKQASSPEELMRSRYTAYHQTNLDYIAKTMKPPASNHFDAKAAKAWAKKCKWVQLEILNTSMNATEGIVEFRAYYMIDHKKYVLHEISEFKLENEQWYYVDGTHPNT